MKSNGTAPVYSSLLLLLLCPLFSGCGGGGMGDTGQHATAGPTAILNGSSIATASNHWASSTCGVQVELAADGGFRFSVSDTSGSTSSGGGTWVASGTDSAVINGAASGLGGFFWVSSLNTIHGSTSSGSFSAGTIVESTGGQQNLGTCTYALQNGVIP